jgi:hypothetical protein
MQFSTIKWAILCTVFAASLPVQAADPAVPKNTRPAAVDGISKEMKDGKGGGKDKLGVNTMKSDGDKGGKGGKDKLGMNAMKSDGDKGDKGGKGGGKDKLGMQAMKSDGEKGGKGPKDKLGANHMMKDKDGGKGPKDKMMGRDASMQGMKGREAMTK